VLGVLADLFIVRLAGDEARYLILETKGFDPVEAIKVAAAERGVRAVNGEGSHGVWVYGLAKKVGVLTGF